MCSGTGTVELPAQHNLVSTLLATHYFLGALTVFQDDNITSVALPVLHNMPHGEVNTMRQSLAGHNQLVAVIQLLQQLSVELRGCIRRNWNFRGNSAVHFGINVRSCGHIVMVYYQETLATYHLPL
jgi:hypothetical protein